MGIFSLIWHLAEAQRDWMTFPMSHSCLSGRTQMCLTPKPICLTMFYHHMNSFWRAIFVSTTEEMLCALCVCVCTKREKGLDFSIKAAQLLTCSWQKNDFSSSGASSLYRVGVGRKGRFHPKSLPLYNDVASILLLLSLKESEGKPLTIVWSAQRPSCNTGTTTTWTQLQCLPVHSAF